MSKTQPTLIFIFSLIFSFTVFASTTKKTLAVSPFKNNSTKEHDWLSYAIADTLIAKFSKEESLKLVEREKVKQLIGQDNTISDTQKLQLIGG